MIGKYLSIGQNYSHRKPYPNDLSLFDRVEVILQYQSKLP